MLTEQDLIGYLENTLSPAERQRVEAELAADSSSRRQLVQQLQLDSALRTALGDRAAQERIKESVLAVLHGGSEEAIKRQVMHDTTLTLRPGATFIGWLKTVVRRPIWAIGFATACVALLIYLSSRQASIERGSVIVSIEMPTRVELASGTLNYKAGDVIRSGDSSSATIRFADGTVLHLEPGTEIAMQALDTSPGAGGKQLKLIRGALSAQVAKQPAGSPLLIQTPQSLLTVVGTEFDLTVASNQTALEVIEGLVKITGAGTQPVSVGQGEFAVAGANSVVGYGRLARNPFLWPFSSASVWNRPLGSAAQFAPVPGPSFLSEGPLRDAVRPRRPFLGSASDPLRRVWVNGQFRADVRLPDSRLPQSGLRDPIVLLQRGRRYGVELIEVSVRPDGDLEAADLERVPLNGSGTIAGSVPALPFGLSNLGGLLRASELEEGIRHALSARIRRARLAGRDFARPLTVWPAAGNPSTAVDQLCVGTLLAIPPEVNLADVVGDSGAGYHLAHAMQDYGVYVTGMGDAPFNLLADRADLPEADAWLNKLVPLLQVVINNSPGAPMGALRRESAPALPGETR